MLPRSVLSKTCYFCQLTQEAEWKWQQTAHFCRKRIGADASVCLPTFLSTAFFFSFLPLSVDAGKVYYPSYLQPWREMLGVRVQNQRTQIINLKIKEILKANTRLNNFQNHLSSLTEAWLKPLCGLCFLKKTWTHTPFPPPPPCPQNLVKKGKYLEKSNSHLTLSFQFGKVQVKLTISKVVNGSKIIRLKCVQNSSPSIFT